MGGQRKPWGKSWGRSWGNKKWKWSNPMCTDMIKKGECPRGEACKYCKKMIEKFGTNDWTDEECWNVRNKGECNMEYCKWCPDKPDPTPGMRGQNKKNKVNGPTTSAPPRPTSKNMKNKVRGKF